MPGAHSFRTVILGLPQDATITATTEGDFVVVRLTSPIATVTFRVKADDARDIGALLMNTAFETRGAMANA